MTTATDKYLQCWGSTIYNRVEAKQGTPKLRFIKRLVMTNRAGEIDRCYPKSMR